MTDFETIELSVNEHIATIRLNRPNAANGMNLALTTELAAAAEHCYQNDAIKVIILTGNGRFFSAGGDINAMQQSEDGPGSGVKRIADELHKAISLFSRMAQPVICAVNGTAAGAGFSLAVSADLVVAADNAKFTMAYSNVGLSPDGSASYFLPRLIGIRKTQELMLTNRVLSAQEAMDWGLVTRCVSADDLQDEAMTIAKALANGARGSNAAIKALLLQSFANDLDTQMDMEAKAIAKNADSADGHEGVAAFLEKRRPEFS